jgi:hypothetical protein
MEKRLAEIMKKLEENKSTHPNVTTLWQCFLTKKLDSLNKELDNCERLLNDIIPNMQDLSLTTMFMIGQIPMRTSEDNHS